MANRINWHQMNQPIRGDVLQMQGNPSANHVTPASGVASIAAPAGTNYASVWSSNALGSLVSADILSVGSSGEDITSGFTIAIPADTILEIPNILPSKTKITMTDIV